MSSRRENPEPARRRAAGRSGAIRPEPEVASASGGQLAPDVQATGPPFDPLGATEAEPRLPPPWTTPHDVPPAHERRPAPSQQQRRRRRPTVRRVRRTLRHVDPVSVLKLSLVFYGVFLIVWLVIAAILFAMIEATGIFETIEGLSRDFALGLKVNIDLFFVERWAFLMGLTFAIVASLVNVALAFLYNLAADTIGGIEMTFVEKDSSV